MEKKEPIGIAVKPMLMILENAVWDYEAESPELPKFDDESFRAIIKLFMTALVERIWLLQETEDMDGEDRLKMVNKAGNEIRNMIKVYADIDTKQLYKYDE